jgi:hypothetical protein
MSEMMDQILVNFISPKSHTKICWSIFSFLDASRDAGWPISLVDILANLEAADKNEEFLLPPEARRRFEMPKVGRQTSVEILEAVRVADQFLAWIFTASRKGANKDPESIEYDSEPRMKTKCDRTAMIQWRRSAGIKVVI